MDLHFAMIPQTYCNERTIELKKNAHGHFLYHIIILLLYYHVLPALVTNSPSSTPPSE